MLLRALLFSLALISTSSMTDELMYQELIDDVPKVDTLNTVYLGDRMLYQRRGMYASCFVPKQRLAITYGSEFEFLKNNPVCKRALNSDAYTTTYTLNTNCRGKEDQGTCPLVLNNPVKLVETETNYELHVGTEMPFSSKIKYHKKMKLKGIDKQSLKFYEAYFIHNDEDDFQRAIEYAGRNGNSVNFIYSEFSKKMARPAFTREFQIDLSEGNIGAYKGALFEINEASNSTITYKVIRHFPALEN